MVETYRRNFVRFIGDEEGASATEYALFVMLIAVAILAGVGAFGIGLSELYTNNSAQVINALP
jgi:Flp pilus assembly pilin Flp